MSVYAIPYIAQHPYYNRWKTMIKMCSNPNNKHYVRYGEEGVAVDYEWSSGNPDGSRNFIHWVETELSHNPEISKTNFLVTRKGFKGNFGPSNCEVTSRSEVNSLSKQTRVSQTA